MPTFAVSTSRLMPTTTLLHVFVEASHDMLSAGASSAAISVAQSESSVAEHARQSATLRYDASAQPATTAVAAERLKLAVATE